MPTKSYRENQLERLSDPEYSAQYLKIALDETVQDGDMEAFLLALKNVVDAAGAVKQVVQVVSDADVSRQHLHRLFSGTGNLTFQTTISILNAVGLMIDFKPTPDNLQP